ncbi:MAG TPA: hypothetical protein VLH40_10190 [Atribacteraceae bacterium]|nr:hypothetical protein [Atribacteraceae bacterium]
MRILPMETNFFDRLFIGIVVMFGTHLLWVRFLEQFVPLLAATVGSLVFLILLLIYG